MNAKLYARVYAHPPPHTHSHPRTHTHQCMSTRHQTLSETETETELETGPEIAEVAEHGKETKIEMEVEIKANRFGIRFAEAEFLTWPRTCLKPCWSPLQRQDKDEIRHARAQIFTPALHICFGLHELHLTVI
jgi:hypothetical protein